MKSDGRKVLWEVPTGCRNFYPANFSRWQKALSAALLPHRRTPQKATAFFTHFKNLKQMIEFLIVLFLALQPGHNNNTTTNDDGTGNTTMDTTGETGPNPNHPPPPPPKQN